MKDLIRKILKENIDSQDGLEWADNLDDNDIDFKMSAGLVYHIFGLTEASKKYILKEIGKGFRDIKVEGDQIIFRVSDWCDLSKLFYEGDSNGYVNEYMAKAMFCGSDDDWWSDYNDLVPRNQWKEIVWKLVEGDEGTFNEVLKFIKKNYVSSVGYNPKQLDIFGELPKKQNVVTVDGRVLDTEFFNEITQDKKYLGELIDDEDAFSDLKKELRWSYEDAYNTAARDQIWGAAKDAVTNLLGDGNWTNEQVNINGNPVTRHYLEFNVTKLFWEIVTNFFDNCWENCFRYGRNSDEDDYEALQDECPDCLDPSGDYDFLDLTKAMLGESNDLLNPRYQEWPDDDDIEVNFSESVSNRI